MLLLLKSSLDFLLARFTQKVAAEKSQHLVSIYNAVGLQKKSVSSLQVIFCTAKVCSRAAQKTKALSEYDHKVRPEVLSTKWILVLNCSP